MVRWDVTTWHNYEVYGDLLHIGKDDQTTFNLLQYVHSAYGRPILITEWAANPEDDDATKAAYLTKFLGEYHDNRATYGILSAQWYELGGTPWGLLEYPQTGMAFAAYVAAHPDG